MAVALRLTLLVALLLLLLYCPPLLLGATAVPLAKTCHHSGTPT
jgi:hypothetical protein